MTILQHTNRLLPILTIVATSFAAGVADSFAHCDTMNGPVVRDARHALETGDLTPVLKWVAPQDEAEVEDAFARTMSVRDTGEQVRELADLYFFETVVRLHRMSEGVGYTGLKPATAVAPAIAAADRALETGDVNELTSHLVERVHAALAERFAHAYEARAHADDSIESGRAFVHAYVLFTHFAEEIGAVTQHAMGADPAGSAAAHAHE